MKKWKQALSICLTCALLSGSMTVFADSGQTESAAETTAEEGGYADAAGITAREGQLTEEAIHAMNGGTEKIFSHNGQVTFVEGTCADGPVKSAEDAAAVVDSMMTLIGANADTFFVPWRELTDPLDHHYYVFQQMYENTTVCGGAVKVITDAEGRMIALTSSVESTLPEVGNGDEITAEEAEQIVLAKCQELEGRKPEILSQHTGKVILPSVLVFDIENEDESSRFVYVVYTDHRVQNGNAGTQLPYLAHYVSMSGEYLYNMPTIIPDDEASQSGFDTSYVFEFMEPAEYTGYVDLSDGTEKEITVNVMRDKRTGMYYLGDIERRILVAECYDFLYDGGRIVLEASPDNREWDQVGLLSLYNYGRAYDYYKEIGWVGCDGEQTPILVLNNFCDDHYNEVNNACYVGKVYGMQCFLASRKNDFSQCLDVITHEFTHCVTHSVTTYNAYINDYGAINEALSDIQGKNCEMMAGDVDEDDWILGSNSNTPVRSMSDPHLFQQPEYTWDLYYSAKIETPTPINDRGGVHSNSSLLNRVAYLIMTERGMTHEEARTFWFMVDSAMVPKTDYLQLTELLPWVLKAAGMEQYEEALDRAIEATRLSEEGMPETIDEDRAILTMKLPSTDVFNTGNWMLMLNSVRSRELIGRALSLLSELISRDYSSLPESIREKIEDVIEKEESGTEDNLVDVILNIAGDILNKGVTPVDLKEKKKEARDLFLWLQSEIQDYIFSSYGAAGTDGSTVRMVVRPGRTIPLLLHATVPEGSEELDQITVAVYLHGRWYAFPADETGSDPEAEKQMEENVERFAEDLFGKDFENLENIRSLEDILDLFTVNIEGGQCVELSSDGLETVVIPDPTPAEEKPYAVIPPGAKSRPKEKAEEVPEDIDTAA